jgi:hypothetical protein
MFWPKSDLAQIGMCRISKWRSADKARVIPRASRACGKIGRVAMSASLRRVKNSKRKKYYRVLFVQSMVDFVLA